MKIAVLVTELYPDQETLRDGLGVIAAKHDIEWIELDASRDNDSHWDAVLNAVLNADRVVCL